MKKGEHIMVTISTEAILKAILFVIGIAVLFALKQLVLVLLVAIVIASSLEPLVQKMMRYHIPRVASVLMVYFTILGAFTSILFVFLPPVLDDLSGVLGRVPALIESIETSGSLVSIPIFEGNDGAGNQSVKDAIESFRSSFSTAGEGFLRTITAIFGNVLSFVLVIVFSFYFAVQVRGIEEFLRLITPIKYEEQVIDLWYRSERKIGLWMQGQLILALLIGVFVFLGLSLLNVPYALLLGLLAMIFEIIPVFGPILAAIPGIGLAFVAGGPLLALIVACFYLVIQQFESHLLQPLVVGQVVGVPPLLVLLSLVIGAELAGFMGILLAVPVAAVVQELVSDVRRSRSLSRDPKGA